MWISNPEQKKYTWKAIADVLSPSYSFLSSKFYSSSFSLSSNTMSASISLANALERVDLPAPIIPPIV